ncbi:MAG: DUF2335 domain-containing protein, partial [Chloroflexi bacterium]|nr:DUF2335 domain-containing protein [Chloroflexota bacterium]
EFSGPIPPPSLLSQYEQAFPGLADRIVKMAEREQTHRHHIEDTRDEAAVTTTRMGLNRAFWLVMFISAGSVYLIATGRDTAGLILILGQLVLLAGAFITRQITSMNKQTPEGNQSQVDTPQS